MSLFRKPGEASRAIGVALPPRSLIEAYREGFAAGAVSAFMHLLDDPAAEYPGGAFKGELPDDAERWARDALARTQEYLS